jgi:hypothetical protein
LRNLSSVGSEKFECKKLTFVFVGYSPFNLKAVVNALLFRAAIFGITKIPMYDA